MKLIIIACLYVIAALGCGAPPEEFDAELGQDEQPLITQVQSTSEEGCISITGAIFEPNPFQGLTYTGSTCMESIQTIYVPRTRNVTLKTTNGSCSATDFQEMTAKLDIIIAELNTPASLGGAGGWTFTRTANGTNTVTCVSLPSNPLGGNSIRNFVRAKPVGSSVIFDSDSVADGAVFSGWNSLTIQVDVPKIYAKGANANEDSRMLWQAIAHGVEALTGTGEYAGNRMAASDESISGAVGRVMFSLGERCRAKNYATTQPANMFRSSSAGCADN
jgi:hypothetical protein